MPRINREPIPEDVMREVAEEIVAAEQQSDRLLAVVHAARVWHVARHGNVVGDTYSRACRALDDAVALFEGEPVAEPTPPPTTGELAQSRHLAERLQERSKAIRRAVGLPDSDNRCPGRVVSYADGRTGRCVKGPVGHPGECA